MTYDKEVMGCESFKFSSAFFCSAFFFLPLGWDGFFCDLLAIVAFGTGTFESSGHELDRSRPVCGTSCARVTSPVLRFGGMVTCQGDVGLGAIFGCNYWDKCVDVKLWQTVARAKEI